MNILITGAKGMLGTDLCEVLTPAHTVTGVDLDEVDIADLDAVKDQVMSVAPDLVINVAAYTDVDGCEDNVELAFRANADGVENLATVCREQEVNLIHLSTDYVFDGTRQRPYHEEDPPRPMGVYGRSKLEGETRAQRILPQVCIIRTAWLYGRAGKNFIKAILAQADKTNTLKVVDDQKGSPTFTLDLARALRAAAEQGLAGVYHVTNKGECSWFEFAQKILELAGRRDVEVLPISTGELGRPAPRPANSVMDGTKFEKASGMPLRPWPEALKEYLLEPDL